MQRLIAALACALAVASCSKTGESQTAQSGVASQAPAASSHPGALRIAIQRSPNTLNPILAANTTEGMVNRLSFDVLVSVDPSGKTLVPKLAARVPTLANGGISKDGLTITYSLRPHVLWHDGQPFTSHDVKFTWAAIMNNANNVNTRNGYDRIASVDTPNPLTVVFHLKQKFAPFVNTIFAESDNPFCILPEHLLKSYPDLNRVAFNTAPIGTGPFKVSKWIRGDRIEYVANDAYFLGKPKLRTVTVRDIPDENTSINLLRTGDIDFMFEASPDTVQALKPLEAAGTIRLAYEAKPETLRLYINTSRPTLADVRVRQAIAYAVDKEALVAKSTGGTAVVATSDQPTFSPYYEPNVMKYTLDIAKAKALLQAAGYSYGPDGSANKNGRQLSLQLSYNVENATRRTVVVQVQSMLKAIGIDAPIKAYPANLLFATLGQGGILTGAKYDLNVSGWVAGIDPDDSTLYACNQFPPAGTNYDRYCSREMDAAQQAALSSYDPAKRKPAYSTIQKLIARDVPDISVWYPRQLEALSPAFHGYAGNPVTASWNAAEWEI